MTSPLVITEDKHVPINSTVKESTLARLDVLVAKLRARNPSINRSKAVNTMLVEKLDELGIQLPSEIAIGK